MPASGRPRVRVLFCVPCLFQSHGTHPVEGRYLGCPYVLQAKGDVHAMAGSIKACYPLVGSAPLQGLFLARGADLWTKDAQASPQSLYFYP